MEDFSKYNGEGTMLRKAQLRMLEILVEVDKICKKHSISYWLDYGTLLGAVRHGGFIPWDDDMDISMMKEDYDRFLAIAQYELPERLVIQNTHTEKYFPYSVTRIVDLNSETTRYGRMGYSHCKRKCKGLWIDIFPIERGNVRLYQWLNPLYGRCFRRVHRFESFGISVLIAYILYPSVWILKRLMDFLNKFCNDELRMHVLGEENFCKQKYYSDYLPSKEIRFEGISFPVPNRTDKVLTDYYGNYMQVPPKYKRETHLAEIVYIK